MPITRTPMVDDDGTGTTGTIINNAWKQQFYDQIDATLLGGAGLTANYISSGATGVLNNFACGPACFFTVLNFANAADLTFHGVTFTTPPRLGDQVLIQARGPGNIYLPQNSGTSTYKWSNLVTSAPTPLGVGGRALYTYIGSNAFALTFHEQGAWITPPYNASDYTAASGTWTVPAGSVITCRYRLSGKALQFHLFVTNTTTSGATISLRRMIPGGFSSAQRIDACHRGQATGVASALMLTNIPTPGNILDFYVNMSGSTTWPAVNNIELAATLVLEVT